MSSEEVFGDGGALEKLPPRGSVASELQGAVQQLDYLQDIYCHVIDELGDVSRSIKGIQFTTRKVTLALKELKRELAKRESQLTVLGDAHDDLSEISSFSTPKRRISPVTKLRRRLEGRVREGPTGNGGASRLILAFLCFFLFHM